MECLLYDNKLQRLIYIVMFDFDVPDFNRFLNGGMHKIVKSAVLQSKINRVILYVVVSMSTYYV
jgi:hypothetical protein